MHILVTDVLACPRCGSGHGLVLLADRVEDRRVLEGDLGCSNCRERYPVRGGFGDLREPGSAPLGPPPAGSPGPPPGDEEGAVRLAALLNLQAGRGLVALVGDVVRWAPGLAALVDGLEVIAVEPALRAWAESGSVSRMAAGERLPFHDRSLRGVALGAAVSARLLAEAARVVAPAGRLVLEGAPPDARARLRSAGLTPLAEEAGTVVAARTGPV